MQFKMTFFGFRNTKRLSQELAIASAPDDSATFAAEKQVPITTDDDSSLERRPSEDVQDGVKKVEAVTLTWTRNELLVAYGW